VVAGVVGEKEISEERTCNSKNNKNQPSCGSFNIELGSIYTDGTIIIYKLSIYF